MAHVPQLTNYLEHSGLSHPFSKVYTSADPIHEIPLVMFLFVISFLGRFTYQVLLMASPPDATSLGLPVPVARCSQGGPS